MYTCFYINQIETLYLAYLSCKMPNWCENSVTLEHSNIDRVKELEQLLKSYPNEGSSEESYQKATLFGYYLPRPKNVHRGEIAEWNNKMWGTKCEPILISFQKDNDNTISILLDTAWSPPIGIYEYFVNNGWSVEALYHEPGYAFCGKFTNAKGDECYDYDTDDTDMMNKIPKDIVEFACILDDSDTDTSDNSSDGGSDYDRNDDKEVDEDDDYQKLYIAYNKEREGADVCHNKAVLSNDNTRFIDELESALNMSILDLDYEVFNILFPRDEDEEPLDWNLIGWGTRCEPKVLSYKRINTNTLEFEFNTAWTPPIKLYNFLAEENWVVKALYHSKEGKFCGHYTNDHGDLQYDYEKNTSRIPREVLEFARIV